MRIGIGYDVHQLVTDRPLILGGINISYHKGLLGHSDADVLIHAIMDAILGAAALGNIGDHFPDTDHAYKGACSLKLLTKVHELIQKHNFTLGNIDSVIIAQQPKLKPYIADMVQKLATTLNIIPNKISIKATTTEKLGFEGQELGISAQAVVLLNEKNY